MRSILFPCVPHEDEFLTLLARQPAAGPFALRRGVLANPTTLKIERTLVARKAPDDETPFRVVSPIDRHVRMVRIPLGCAGRDFRASVRNPFENDPDMHFWLTVGAKSRWIHQYQYDRKANSKCPLPLVECHASRGGIRKFDGPPIGMILEELRDEDVRVGPTGFPSNLIPQNALNQRINAGIFENL